MSGFTNADVPDQSGKTFIVTGANSGIGFEIASTLAARRARVLLVCRDMVKAEAAISRIRLKTPEANLAFLPLDLADLTSVRNAAKLAEKEPRITALMLPKLTKTSGSRIVVTSSGLHRDAKIEWDDLDAEKSYQWMSRYAASKLANLLFVIELDRLLRADESFRITRPLR